MRVFVVLGAMSGVFLLVSKLEYMLDWASQLIGGKMFELSDTRSFIYEEMENGMSGIEWLRGKGFMGTYHSEYFLNLIRTGDASGDYYERFSVEVGALELILKGGFLLLALYIGILLIPSFRAMFRRNTSSLNYFIGVYVFGEILLMFIENIPYFSFHFSMLFFLSGYVYQRMETENLRVGKRRRPLAMGNPARPAMA